jgi:hypothetical protein
MLQIFFDKVNSNFLKNKFNDIMCMGGSIFSQNRQISWVKIITSEWQNSGENISNLSM